MVFLTTHIRIQPRIQPSPVAFVLAWVFAATALCSPAAQAQMSSVKPPVVLLPALITADSVLGELETQAVLQGNVALERGKQRLLAPKIDYSALTDEVKATGGVILFKDQDVFRAPELQINLATDAAYAADVNFFYSKYNARGKAQSLQMSPTREHLLSDVHYTTCKPGQNDWEIAAKTINIDNNTETGYAKNMVFRFFDVPLLALPYFEFPLGRERRSGVLPPSLSYSSGTGLDVSVPYYFNLANHYDLTLDTRFMARRGLHLSAKTRYLTGIGSGDMTLEAMPNDAVLQQKRWAAFAHNTYKLGDLSAGWNLERVSDDAYFKDLSRNIGAATQSHLPADLWLRYQPRWGSVDMRAVQYQTLQDTANTIVPTYGRLPSLSLNTKPLVLGASQLNLDANLTRFTHPTQVQGTRSTVQPSWLWEAKREWGYLKLKSGLSASQYIGLSAFDPTYTGITAATRVLPVSSLDTGLVFDRSTHWLGTPATQTLEPRLFYLNVPFKDQSNLPNFDTAISDFGFSQIFSENVFNGGDRIADANHLTAALTSRWIGSASSAELFKLTFGKRYYFTPQRVQLTGPSLAGAATASDWLFAASGTLGAGFSLDLATQYDQTAGDTIKNALTLKFNPQAKQFVSVSKRFTKNTQDLVDLSWQWKLSPSSAFMGRVNYSLGVPATNLNAAVAKGVTESLLGYEYDAGCWVFRVAANRYSTASNTKNTSLYFQIDFSGLSHVGSGSLDTIKRNVPGYTPFESKPNWSYDPFKPY